MADTMTIAGAPLAELEGQAFPGFTFAELEAQEAATLRLSLTDDRILDSKFGKTPVMVLQEHCHRMDEEGDFPIYEDDTDAFQNTDNPGFAITVRLQGLTETGYDDKTKRKAKQRAALQMLRQLYPEVDLWGDLLRSFMPRAP